MFSVDPWFPPQIKCTRSIHLTDADRQHLLNGRTAEFGPQDRSGRLKVPEWRPQFPPPEDMFRATVIIFTGRNSGTAKGGLF